MPVAPRSEGARPGGAREKDKRLLGIVQTLIAVTLLSSSASAQDSALPFPDEHILDAHDSTLRIQSIATRVTAFDQYGHGFQSQAGPVRGPGSERATIFEPQAEVIATQGERLTHRLWVPVDVVTAASPNSIARPDAMSGASRRVIAGTMDWTATYKVDASTDLSMRNGLHLEEPFRSWHNGLMATHSLADDNTLLSANVIELIDWFDRFDIHGSRHGHTTRTGTSGTVSMTQIVTATTVVNVNYGITVLAGTMGNTWNSVPVAGGSRGAERLPDERVRHALVARASQFLPWNGVLRAYYRFYTDDWGIIAHSMEAQIMQRLSSVLYVGGLYRFHTQTGTTFFTTRASPAELLRVADSDLAPLDSHTIGGKVVADFPLMGQGRPWHIESLHFEAGYERYFRTNDLQMNIVTWEAGFHF